MNLRETIGMGEDGWNFSVGALSVFFGLSLLVSAIAWPIVYYNTETSRVTMEKGYEWSTDNKGHIVIQKAGGVSGCRCNRQNQGGQKQGCNPGAP
jgi:hypothetical protein